MKESQNFQKPGGKRRKKRNNVETPVKMSKRTKDMMHGKDSENAHLQRLELQVAIEHTVAKRKMEEKSPIKPTEEDAGEEDL